MRFRIVQLRLLAASKHACLFRFCTWLAWCLLTGVLSVQRGSQAVVPKDQLQVSVLKGYLPRLWGWEAGDRVSCGLAYVLLSQGGVYQPSKGTRKLHEPGTNVVLRRTILSTYEACC